MYQFVVAELPKLNQQVENIQYGGCCVFAEELYKTLTDLGLEPKVCFFTSNPSGIEYFIEHGELEPFGHFCIGHAVIEVDGVFIDNTGVYADQSDFKETTYSDKRVYKQMFVSLKALMQINENVRGWNRRFNRDQIPQVKEFLNEVKENLKKNLVS